MKGGRFTALPSSAGSGRSLRISGQGARIVNLHLLHFSLWPYFVGAVSIFGGDGEYPLKGYSHASKTETAFSLLAVLSSILQKSDRMAQITFPQVRKIKDWLRRGK